VNKSSKKTIDIVNNLMYSTYTKTTNSYEQKLVEMMIDEGCTLSQALEIDFDMAGVDKKSVIGIVDYLEDNLVDLNKVELLMDIYLGRCPDMHLTPL
jgi:hypothetical protein